MVHVINGNSELEMIFMESDSIDSIVTDPPYGWKFMGRKWDYDIPTVNFWKEAYRVLKPGAHMLVACGTRTQHRMAVNIEDAGFEIRDVIAWVYGSGFPKSLDISKAIDKAAGAEREIIGEIKRWGANASGGRGCQNGNSYQESLKGAEKFNPLTKPATDSAKQWDGWGTALKPAMELWTLARKPLEKKTVAENVLEYGTGGINIDACRIHGDDAKGGEYTVKRFAPGASVVKDGNWKQDKEFIGELKPGRFPANFIHDGSDEVMDLFPRTKSGTILPHHFAKASENRAMSGKNYGRTGKTSIGDEGSAARFFYCAKASKSDRGEGNTHETVKPTDLMRYLCRLITPPGGVILDPFAGSGTTGKSAALEGFDCILIEQQEKHIPTIERRVREAEEEFMKLKKDQKYVND